MIPRSDYSLGMEMDRIDEGSEILKDWYKNYYHKVLRGSGAQAHGADWIDTKLEQYWNDKSHKPKKLLEVGFASGEHLSKVAQFPTNEYVGLDIAPPSMDEYIRIIPKEISSIFRFVLADVQKIPFPDNYFDRVVSTCLLHHVLDPLRALREIRRVVSPGGEISIALPTDPGLMNQWIKKVVTYPKMKKLGVRSPSLIYALEHKNQIAGILSILEHVFEKDNLDLRYLPFRIKSWNLNPLIIAHVTVS